MTNTVTPVVSTVTKTLAPVTNTVTPAASTVTKTLAPSPTR